MGTGLAGKSLGGRIRVPGLGHRGMGRRRRFKLLPLPKAVGADPQGARSTSGAKMGSSRAAAGLAGRSGGSPGPVWFAEVRAPGSGGAPTLQHAAGMPPAAGRLASLRFPLHPAFLEKRKTAPAVPNHGKFKTFLHPSGFFG